MPKRLTQEEYQAKFDKEYPTLELLSPYKGNKEYIHVRCRIDGNEFDTKPNWLSHGQGCAVCYHRRQSEFQKIPLSEQIRRIQEKYTFDGGKSLYGLEKEQFDEADYENCHQTIPWYCNKHNITFYRTPTKLLNDERICPMCQAEINVKSHTHREMKGILEENGIRFEEEKAFPWLKRKFHLRLDFYVPDYKIAIECQGEQHFKPVEHFGGVPYLRKIQERDKIKKDLCEEHGITVKYIANYEALRKIKNIEMPYPLVSIEDDRQEIISWFG